MPNSIKKNVIFLISSLLIIAFCYFYVDRTLSFWLYEQHFSQYLILKKLTKIVDLLYIATACIYGYYLGRFVLDQLTTLDRKLLLIANSVVVTFFFKNQLKYVFGRYWPQTWTHGNPSLIDHNAYGFHFFTDGSWYQSFPSGHTAITVAAMSAVWMLFPKLRWASIALPLSVVVGLLGMNYHFISDILAGGTLGLLISRIIAALMGHKSFKDNSERTKKIF